MATVTPTIDFSAAEMRKVYVANCHICTLASQMKDCALCPFHIGLFNKPLYPEISSVTQEPI